MIAVHARRQFSINVKAIINVSQVVSKKMIEQKKPGVIVSLSSQASKVRCTRTGRNSRFHILTFAHTFQIALRGHTVYCAAKAAVDAITRVMTLELGKHNIRAVTVGPTVVNTDMGKLGWSDPAKAKPMLDRIPLGRFAGKFSTRPRPWVRTVEIIEYYFAFAEVDEIVNVILFLASDRAAMVSGVMLPIDGGTLAA